MFRAGLANKRVERCVTGPGIKKATAMLYQLEEELRVGHGGTGRGGGNSPALAVGVVGAHHRSRTAQGLAHSLARRPASSPDLRGSPPTHVPIVPPPPPPPTAHADIVQLTDQTFDGAVMASLDEWVVLFWKIGCKSCERFKPTFKAAAGRIAAISPDVHIAMIEREHTEAVAKFRLAGFPALGVRAGPLCPRWCPPPSSPHPYVLRLY